MRIVVSSKEFDIFVDAILNIDRSGATFKIFKEYIECLSMTEDNSSIFLYSKIDILNKDEIEIENGEECKVIHIKDLTQFKKLLSINSGETFTFILEENYVYYESDKIKRAKFMLGERSYRSINARITADWFSSFDINLRMTISKNTIKDILRAASFASSDADKVYFYQEGVNVIAEVNDRTKDNLDNISIVIGEREEGEIESKVIVATSSLAKIHLADNMILESTSKGTKNRKIEMLFLTIKDENVIIKYLLNTQMG